jgi:hypothetical protein
MKKVLNIRYLLQAYRFSRDIEDFEMMEQYFYAIREELKGKPYLYKRFIHRRMAKGFKPLNLFAVLRRLT